VNEDPTPSLRAWIIDALFAGVPPADFDDDTDLIADGVMDSVAILRTLGHLEADHGVVTDPSDIVPEHFVSVRTLSEFVAARRGA
jgi:acyl carrier protein